jgi:hypothetical protein
VIPGSGDLVWGRGAHVVRRPGYWLQHAERAQGRCRSRARLRPSAAASARRGAASDSALSSQPEHGACVHRLDQALHPASRSSASVRDGCGGDPGVPLEPGDGGPHQRLDTESGTLRPALPLPRRLQSRTRLDGRPGPRPPPGAAPRGPDPGGGLAAPPAFRGSRVDSGEPPLRRRTPSDGMLSTPGEGRGLRIRAHFREGRQGERGPARALARQAPQPSVRAPAPRESSARRGSLRRLRIRGTPGRARPQLPERAARMGMAVGLSGDEALRGPGDWRAPPTPPPRVGAPARGEGRGQEGRYHEAGNLPHLAPFLRDAPAGGGVRHPDDPGTARAQERRHYDDLHARAQPGRTVGAEPPGWAVMGCGRSTRPSPPIVAAPAPEPLRERRLGKATTAGPEAAHDYRDMLRSFAAYPGRPAAPRSHQTKQQMGLVLRESRTRRGAPPRDDPAICFQRILVRRTGAR